MKNEPLSISRDVNVECSLQALPLGARMRANAEIMFAWMRRALRARS